MKTFRTQFLYTMYGSEQQKEMYDLTQGEVFSTSLSLHLFSVQMKVVGQ